MSRLLNPFGFLFEYEPTASPHAATLRSRLRGKLHAAWQVIYGGPEWWPDSVGVVDYLTLGIFFVIPVGISLCLTLLINFVWEAWTEPAARTAAVDYAICLLPIFVLTLALTAIRAIVSGVLMIMAVPLVALVEGVTYLLVKDDLKIASSAFKKGNYYLTGLSNDLDLENPDVLRTTMHELEVQSDDLDLENPDALQAIIHEDAIQITLTEKQTYRLPLASLSPTERDVIFRFNFFQVAYHAEKKALEESATLVYPNL